MKPGFIKALLSVIIISFLSLIITVFILEIGFRILLPQPLDFHNLNKIMRISSDTVPSKQLIPNSKSNYYGVPNEINSLGLRDNEFNLQKPKNKVRIVFLGDSVTYGIGVRLGDTFPKLVERILNTDHNLNAYETINAGVIGYNLSNDLESLKNKVFEFNPDVVMLGICLNDTIDDVTVIMRNNKAFNIYKFNQFFRNRSHFYFFLQERLRRLMYQYGVIEFREVKVSKFLEGDISEKDYYKISHNLSEMKNLTLLKNIKFAVIIFPYKMQLDKRYLNMFSLHLGVNFRLSILDGNPQRLIKNVCKKMDIPVLDLLGPFRQQKDEDLFINSPYVLDWVHLNTKGHNLAAQEISKFLKNIFFTEFK